MRIIPVMDLQGGVAVHAVRGERSRYRPVTGALTSDGDPAALAQAFQGLGLPEAYIADLDAIRRCGDHSALITDLARRSGLKIMADAGAANAAQAEQILALGVQKVVIGSETLAGLDELHAMCSLLPASQVVFSLDMRSSQVLANCPELAALSPWELLDRVDESGWQEVILLDLARVGAASGPDLALIAATHARHPRLSLLAGGGVRDMADLLELRSAGAAGALVGTALHNGTIGRQDIAHLAAR